MKSILRHIVFTVLLFSCVPLCAQEEEVHGQLAQFRDICILERSSIAANDLDGMADCLAMFSEMNILNFADGVFRFLQPMKKDALKGHLQFSVDYLSHYVEGKMDEIVVEEDEHTLRATPTGDPLFTVHCVIPAHRTCTYEYDGSNWMELLVVCEREQKLGVKIDVASSGIHHQCSNTVADGVRQFSWGMNSDGKVRLSITNPGNQAVSVVVASN
ncbi:MAG: hypothetical protein IKT00_04360 [Prevotella sp.]|nr:hypothetical protein [Prevotella sp.]